MHFPEYSFRAVSLYNTPVSRGIILSVYTKLRLKKVLMRTRCRICSAGSADQSRDISGEKWTSALLLVKVIGVTPACYTNYGVPNSAWPHCNAAAENSRSAEGCEFRPSA